MKRDAPDSPALDKPRQPGGIRAVILAVLVHAAFFGLIVFGVAWQNKPTPPMQAELWDKLPPVAKAPPPAKSEPRPEPEPPKPEPPKPQPKPPEPVKQPVKPEPVKPDPAIALKAEREKRERLEKQKADDRKKREQEQADRKKAEREETEKKKREDEKRRRDEEIAKQAAEKARAEAVSVRQKEIDGFINGIKAKIRGRANVPDTVTGSPEVHVRIRILPGGEVLDIAITKPSGNPAYDTAIERAIRSASPLPVPDARSELFPIFRDLNLQIRHER
ncbi:MAG TPA: cell envelope integrity protein TolA [Usitatibacter sp.]|nr:cell envelope integrity protein TolA [Usitatibacter sp.]